MCIRDRCPHVQFLNATWSDLLSCAGIVSYSPLKALISNLSFSPESPFCMAETGFQQNFSHPHFLHLSLIHICRCRRYAVCRSRWSPYH
eukprot:TRINITY_DN1493_c0_g5_i1.p1 TRINITY_DN1493_c0_g5~~TRINITY_DN1493_c0_g5_i1.p1  ORF type:complete len:104 (-),score=5.29 TRINITY_DN1493_c0_g5_i1:54-320(-)